MRNEKLCSCIQMGKCHIKTVHTALHIYTLHKNHKYVSTISFFCGIITHPARYNYVFRAYALEIDNIGESKCRKIHKQENREADCLH